MIYKQGGGGRAHVAAHKQPTSNDSMLTNINLIQLKMSDEGPRARFIGCDLLKCLILCGLPDRLPLFCNIRTWPMHAGAKLKKTYYVI